MLLKFCLLYNFKQKNTVTHCLWPQKTLVTSEYTASAGAQEVEEAVHNLQSWWFDHTCQGVLEQVTEL